MIAAYLLAATALAAPREPLDFRLRLSFEPMAFPIGGTFQASYLLMDAVSLNFSGGYGATTTTTETGTTSQERRAWGFGMDLHPAGEGFDGVYLGGRYRWRNWEAIDEDTADDASDELLGIAERRARTTTKYGGVVGYGLLLGGFTLHAGVGLGWKHQVIVGEDLDGAVRAGVSYLLEVGIGGAIPFGRSP